MAKASKRGNGSGTIYKRKDRSPWYISFYAADGKRKVHNTLTTDKQAAQRILAKKQADVALRRDGLIDTRQEAIAIEGGKAMAEHLAAFEAMMNANQRSEGHVKRTVAFITEVCAAANFTTPRDVSADAVNKIIADMK